MGFVILAARGSPRYQIPLLDGSRARDLLPVEARVWGVSPKEYLRRVIANFDINHLLLSRPEGKSKKGSLSGSPLKDRSAKVVPVDLT